MRELRALRILGIEAPVEETSTLRRAVARSDLVIEHADTVGGQAKLRPALRQLIEDWGGKLVGTPAGPARAADDKIEVGRRLRAAGLRVPRSRVVGELTRLPARGFPRVLKLPFEHGSRGVALVRGREELRSRSREWLEAGQDTFLLEEFIDGLELAVSVIEARGRPTVLHPVEVRLGPGETYSASRKWGAEDLPIALAELSSSELGLVTRDVLRAFEALDLRDYARFDIRLPSRRRIGRRARRACFLDANVRPSVEEGTELRLSAGHAGLDGARLLTLILASAAGRHGLGYFLAHLEGALDPAGLPRVRPSKGLDRGESVPSPAKGP